MFEQDADSAYLKDLGNEIAEVGVRGAVRNRGYFKAAATATLRVLWSEGADISVTVTISATLGPQYRQGISESSPQIAGIHSPYRPKS